VFLRIFFASLLAVACSKEPVASDAGVDAAAPRQDARLEDFLDVQWFPDLSWLDPDAGWQAFDDVSLPDIGFAAAVIDYCGCLASNCGAKYQQLFGNAPDQAWRRCYEAAAMIPIAGRVATSGNFLECRALFCADAIFDPSLCAQAAGEHTCR